MLSVFSSPGAVAFELGPITVRWYGILMATAILIGFWLAQRRAIEEHLPADDLLRVAQWSVVAGLIGARLGRDEIVGALARQLEVEGLHEPPGGEVLVRHRRARDRDPGAADRRAQRERQGVELEPAVRVDARNARRTQP